MAHVLAPHDSQEGREGSSLLDLGAQRSCRTTGDPADGRASWRARRARTDRGARAGAPADRRSRRSALFNDGGEPLTAPVRLKGVRVERSRQFGEVYLALARWRGVALEQLCKQLLPS